MYAQMSALTCKPSRQTFHVGEPDRIRTCDLLIKSQLLYQLSYGPTRIDSGGCIDPPISGRLVSMHSEVNVSAPLSIRLCRKCFPFRRRNAGS